MHGASPIFKTANNVTKVNNSIMQQQVWEVGALAKLSGKPEKSWKIIEFCDKNLQKLNQGWCFGKKWNYIKIRNLFDAQKPGITLKKCLLVVP